MNILILTCKFGMGHYSVSLSLAQQITAAFPGARAEVVDFYDYALPNGSDAVYKAFRLLVTRGPGLFNAFYRFTEDAPRSPLALTFLPLADRMEALLEEKKPDAVFATHPFCAQLVSRWKTRRGSSLPLITCVTDVTAHSEWLCPGTDRYLVAAPFLRDALAWKGVPAHKILVTGIPVKAQFKRPPRRSADGPRELLIMGGGLGLIPASDGFYAQLDALPDVHTTLITGDNRRLLDQLEGRYQNITVLGYTDRVWDYMASAHLLLTKPGGITLFEAIASQLPMLVWPPFLEQERRNAQFLLRYQIGRVARKDPRRCAAQIAALLHDPRVLDDMSRRCALLQQELSTREVEGLLADAYA